MAGDLTLTPALEHSFRYQNIHPERCAAFGFIEPVGVSDSIPPNTTLFHASLSRLDELSRKSRELRQSLHIVAYVKRGK